MNAIKAYGKTLQSDEKKRKQLMVFLFFLLLSSLFWLLIKLSDKYTIVQTFDLRFTDIPAEQWMPKQESQEIRLSISTTGFNILKFRLLKSSNHVISLSLSEVPYRRESGNIYTISAENMREELSLSLGIDAGDILFNENQIFFRLEKLESKAIEVKFNNAMQFRNQFGLYEEPKIEPRMIEVFGPKQVLDSLDFIQTEKLIREDVFEGFSTNLKLDIPDKSLKTAIQEVRIEVDVASFTEASARVEIAKPESPQLRLFPAEVQIFYSIALRDYQNINERDFRVELDTTELASRPTLLKVNLKTAPAKAKIKRIVPDQVEYLIMKK
ncbi:MAG: hypothetical protein KJ578_14865 [Bacteroidetes bacterium]|nr:hypothetical protein [Bacteroidota bacterium]MBU1578893.1 hypothetical protein [Bacteroidota bacterium]MBU2464849.1 hypothetical protein [Bacteroidota bacterium]MBU2559058.1 hypothetical protein [Bacteroidota bacterium]